MGIRSTHFIRIALLLGTGLVVSGCGQNGLIVTQSAPLQVGTPEGQGNQLLPAGVTVGCFIWADHASAQVGDTVTFIVQSVPFGPNYTACLTGNHNGLQDLNCDDSAATGPARYEVKMKLGATDIGNFSRHADLKDSGDHVICTTATWNLVVTAAGARP